MVSDMLKSSYFHFRGFSGRAVAAMEKARRDVAAYALHSSVGDYHAAAKHKRYAGNPWAKPCPAVSWKDPEPVGNLPFPQYARRGLAWVTDTGAAGLRLVGRVTTECGGRNGYWEKSDKPDAGGWFTDPYGDVFRDGSGLCYGLVFQLPGRGGKARFVAGYQFGGVDGGPCVDFGTIFEEAAGDYTHWDAPGDWQAARDAARAADGMAQRAAEEEREYQAAYMAGVKFAEKAEEIAALKAETVQLLQERREARKAAAMNYPGMCDALRRVISDNVREIYALRKTRAVLQSGDFGDLTFYPDARLTAAFNEGAGL